MKKVKCELCGYEISIGQLNTHQKKCNGLGPKRMRKSKGLGRGWEKGKTYIEMHGEEKAKEIGNKISKSLTGKSKGIGSSPEKELERKRKISETMISRRIGGYRQGSGRGKQGWYKGIWCDSSWELAWVIFHLEHGLPFERNKEKFQYTFNDRIYTYTPDFKIGDCYIEIKGYMTEQTKAKIDQFPKNLRVLHESDMKVYIDFAIRLYGNDFIKLYGSTQ